MDSETGETRGCLIEFVVLLCVVLIVLPILFTVTFKQRWASPYEVRLESPSDSGTELLIYRGSDLGKFAILAKSPKGEPVRIMEVGEEWWNTFFIQWTKDGKIAVFTLETEPLGREPLDPWTARVQHAGAYDFTAGAVVLESEEGEKDQANTKKDVGDLVVLHGGLNEKRLSLGDIGHMRVIKWFWQVPDFSDPNPPRLFPTRTKGN